MPTAGAKGQVIRGLGGRGHRDRDHFVTLPDQQRAGLIAWAQPSSARRNLDRATLVPEPSPYNALRRAIIAQMTAAGERHTHEGVPVSITATIPTRPPSPGDARQMRRVLFS